MRYIVFAVLLCVAAALLKLSAAGSWSYDKQDDWPGVCETGKRQSPINIRSGDADRVNVAELRFQNYDTKGRFSVTSDGESIPVVRVHGFAAWKQRPYIDGGGLDGSYTLDEIYFVWKRTYFSRNFEQVSEHSIDGHHYPFEIHMVHRGKLDGQEHIAIVAVLVDPWGKNGVNQLDGLFETIAQTGDGKSASSGEKRFKPEELLPAERVAFYRYEGSLTTPNCDEIVTWFVMEAPLTAVNDRQWEYLTYNGRTDWAPNQRRQQPLNGRTVVLRDPSSTKTDPGRSTGGRDSNGTTSGSAAQSRCVFWPLATAIAVLLIVDVDLPDGIFF